jgi:1,4-alpha-glucan branching enzyme
MNRLYGGMPALWQQDFSAAGFDWIDANDAGGNTLSFLRLAQPVTGGGAGPGLTSGHGAADHPDADVVACIANFSAVPHGEYKIGLPQAGRWREVLNTDALGYGGSGVGNLGGIEAVPEPWHGKPASATLTVPPLGVLWLAPE